MFKIRKIILMLAVFTAFSLPSVAFAKGLPFFWSSSQEMTLVADTKLKGESGNLSLCILTSHYNLFFLGLYISNDGYALSNNHCDSDSYFAFNEVAFEKAVKDGFISADVPKKSSLTYEQIFWGFSAWLAIFAAIMYFVFIARSKDDSVDHDDEISDKAETEEQNVHSNLNDENKTSN